MSLYAINRSHILCSSFAFYDFELLVGDRAKIWFDYCVSVAEKIGHPFDKGYCTPGNTKYVLLRNCNRALTKNINKIKDIEVRTSAKEDIGSYGEVEMSFSNKYKYSFSGIQSSFVNNDLITKIGKKFCEIIRPKYGIFYKIPFVYSPHFYVLGAMGLGGLDTEKWGTFYNPKHKDFRNRAAEWDILTEKVHNLLENKVFDLCTDGHLREVYPINFINENHLKYEVFSKTTLKDWILEDPQRGKLEQVTDELWSWTIEDSDLEDVTVALAKSDICLCVNKEDPHRYDYGVRPEDKIKIIPWRERPENQ